MNDISERATAAYNAGNLGELFELFEELDGTNADEYNGWTNRETWAAALHLSNDQDLYGATLELLGNLMVFDRDPERRARVWAGIAGERIEEWATGQVERHLFPAPGDELDPWGQLWRSMISDVGSFWRVDWTAVAASFAEDVAS